MADNADNFKFSLNTTNIGPLNINFSQDFKTNKTLIFANNGSGKTFLSKSFRLLDTQYEKRNEKHDNLLTFDKTNAELKLLIKDKLSNIKIKQGESPLLENSYYIFHVFNSDYVNDVIKSRKYSPIKKEDINGEIVIGTPSVELDEKRAKLSELEIKNLEIKSLIQKEIDDIILYYEKEYKLSNFLNFKQRNMLELKDNLNIDKKKHEVLSTIQNAETEIKKLNSLPDSIEDIQTIQNQPDILDIEKDSEVLQYSYIPLTLEENFKKYVDNNKSFIEHGNGLLKSIDVCPYCKQELNNEAKEIIEKYIKYLSSEENYCKDLCLKEKAMLENFSQRCEENKDVYSSIITKFNELKSYFTDCNDVLDNIDVETDNLKKSISLLISKFEEKYKTPSLSLDISQEYKVYYERLSSLNKKLTTNNSKISQLNKKKSRIERCIREYKNNLIEQITDYNIFALSDKLPEYQFNLLEIQKLNEEILEKEKEFKKVKKTEYFNTLKDLFSMFFQNKYLIEDTDNGFIVKLENNIINDKLNEVLSDGEKSIMAFCNYIAETHIIVNNKKDYNKLFYIIDDPISSLDSDYIYCVANVIRYLTKYFENIKYEKYIILTHNINFARMLIRNKIVSNKFQIKNKNLQKLDEKDFDIPYLHHLKDIYSIYKRNSDISHTTANSVRQILEGIHYFCAPSTTLEDFVNDNFPELSTYTYVNDKSHGNLFSIHSLSDRELKDMITKLIEFIKNNFKGQLDLLDNNI